MDSPLFIITLKDADDYSTVYEMTLDKDVDYHMVVDASQARVAITSSDGSGVPTTYLSRGLFSSQFFRVKATGKYRMRFSGTENGQKVKVEKMAPPVFDEKQSKAS